MSTRQFIVLERWDDTGDEYHGWREVERDELKTPGAWLTREQVDTVIHKHFRILKGGPFVLGYNSALDELFPPETKGSEP